MSHRAANAAVVVATLIVTSCAGRDARPVAISQPQDNTMACAQIQAEIAGNNMAISELGSEKGAKVAQNVIVGVAGIIIPVLWFGMDFKGAASTDLAALQARNQYLGTIAHGERCAPSQMVTTSTVTRQPAAIYEQPITVQAVTAQQTFQRPIVSVPQPEETQSVVPAFAPQPTPYDVEQPATVTRTSPPPVVIFRYASDATRADQSNEFDELINSVANGNKVIDAAN